VKIIPDAMRRPAEIERDELRRRLAEIEEREAACCPEDMPFDEYIRALGEQLARARTEIESKNRLVEQMRAALTKLIGTLEVMSVMPETLGKCPVLAIDAPELEQARAALAAEEGER
jgi:hypothetical protein